MTDRTMSPMLDSSGCFSDEEVAHVRRLHQAIEFAITVARESPTTLDPTTRDLCLVKLQESFHWAAEMLRVPNLFYRREPPGG